MNEIQFSLTFPNIPKTRLPEFKRLASQAVELTQRETGALQYDWFLSKNETMCVVRETYADSPAVLAHIDNLGDLLTELLNTGGRCTVEIFGEPSDELRKAITGIDASVFSYFIGIGRDSP